MWTCPKCGRAFQRQNQSHYCGKAPETIDEYIAAQPEMAQEYLKEIRNAIRAALPGAEEKISWSMPTFWKKFNMPLPLELVGEIAKWCYETGNHP